MQLFGGVESSSLSRAVDEESASFSEAKVGHRMSSMGPSDTDLMSDASADDNHDLGTSGEAFEMGGLVR